MSSDTVDKLISDHMGTLPLVRQVSVTVELTIEKVGPMKPTELLEVVEGIFAKGVKEYPEVLNVFYERCNFSRAVPKTEYQKASLKKWGGPSAGASLANLVSMLEKLDPDAGGVDLRWLLDELGKLKEG